jgi:hypothetical protein
LAESSVKKEFDMKSYKSTVIAFLACVSVAALAVAADSGPSNMAQNGSFETPAAGAPDTLPELWDIFSSHQPKIALAKDVARDGDQAVKLSAQGQRNGNVGVFQVITVEPGRDYMFQADVMNDATEALKGSCYGELSIEWQDADGTEVARSRSKSWGPTLSKTQWETKSVDGTAPANATQARVVVTLFDGPNAAKGSMWIDDLKVVAK